MLLLQKKTVTTYVGATGTPLLFELRYADTGAVVDLTGYTITLRARIGATVKINGGAVTITDAAAGKCQYLPAAAEVDTVAVMLSQLKLVAGGVTQFSEEFDTEVKEPV